MPARNQKIFAQDTTSPAPEIEQEGVLGLEPVPTEHQQGSPFSIPEEGSEKGTTSENTNDGQAQALIPSDQPNTTSFESPFLGDPTFWFLVIPFFIVPSIIYAILNTLSKKEFKELQSIQVDPDKEIRGQFKKAEFVSQRTNRASFDKSLDEFDAVDRPPQVVRVAASAQSTNDRRAEVRRADDEVHQTETQRLLVKPAGPHGGDLFLEVSFRLDESKPEEVEEFDYSAELDEIKRLHTLANGANKAVVDPDAPAIQSNLGSLASANSGNLLTTNHDSTDSSSVPLTEDEFGDDDYNDSEQFIDNELDSESPDQIENSMPSPDDEAVEIDLEDDDSDADYNFDVDEEVEDGDANDAQPVVSEVVADEDSAELDAMLDDSDSDLSEAFNSDTDSVEAKPFDPIGTYEVDDQLDREQLADDLESDEAHVAETALAVGPGAAASGSIFSRLFGWKKRKKNADVESTNEDATQETLETTGSTLISEPGDTNQPSAQPETAKTESEDFDLGAPAFADDGDSGSDPRLEIHPVKTPNLELDDQEFSTKTPTVPQSVIATNLLVDNNGVFQSESVSAETVREPDRAQSQFEQTPTAELLLTNQRLNESIRTMQAELDGLAQRLNATPSTSELDKLTAQLEASENARMELQSELDSVKQTLSEPSGDRGAITKGDESIKPESFEQGAKVGKDNLTLISGIGSKIEKKLYEYGVTSFAQIANWTELDMNRFEEMLAIQNCIGRDKWIDQAKALVEKNH